jgi:hypothetical protein
MKRPFPGLRGGVVVVYGAAGVGHRFQPARLGTVRMRGEGVNETGMARRHIAHERSMG